MRLYWGSSEVDPSVSPARSENAIRVTPARNAPIAVQIYGNDSLDLLEARNICETGIGVQVAHCFRGVNLDSEMELVITLPGIRSFRALGRVRHRTQESKNADHFGLEFTEISNRCRRLISSYIDGRLDAISGRSHPTRF